MENPISSEDGQLDQDLMLKQAFKAKKEQFRTEIRKSNNALIFDRKRTNIIQRILNPQDAGNTH